MSGKLTSEKLRKIIVEYLTEKFTFNNKIQFFIDYCLPQFVCPMKNFEEH